MSLKYPGGFITKSPVAPTAFVAKGIWTLDQALQLKKQGLWPSFALPGAPTIGTATATGSTTATVAFTAPASDGGTAITSYTATSTPDGITGTLSQAGSGTITVTGLTAATSYTFTVKATNGVGESPASAASNSITTVPVIGQAFGGGFFAGQIGTSSVASHNLVVGPLATAETTNQWKNANTSTPGSVSDIDGPQNTADQVADGNSTVYPCAHFCNNLSIGGFSDWYMPAKNELEVCYFNLKPGTQQNSTASGPNGVNPNAVPARASAYPISGPPVQTSAAAFKVGGAQAFTATVTPSYWCSTAFGPGNLGVAERQTFNYGNQNYNSYKNNSFRVRAVRRVAV